MRRSKSDVATELPKKKIILHAEAMSEQQAASYEEARGKLITGKKGPPKSNLTNPIKHDRTPLIMARAPELFIAALGP